MWKQTYKDKLDTLFIDMDKFDNHLKHYWRRNLKEKQERWLIISPESFLYENSTQLKSNKSNTNLRLPPIYFPKLFLPSCKNLK